MLHPQRYAVALTTSEFRGAIALKKSIKKSIKKSQNGAANGPILRSGVYAEEKMLNQADLIPKRIEAPPINATKSRNDYQLKIQDY